MWWLINASVTVFISSALIRCFLSCLEYAFVIKKTTVPNTQFINVYHTEEVDYDLIFLCCAHNIKCANDLLLLIFSFLRRKKKKLIMANVIREMSEKLWNGRTMSFQNVSKSQYKRAPITVECLAHLFIFIFSWRYLLGLLKRQCGLIFKCAAWTPNTQRSLFIKSSANGSLLHKSNSHHIDWATHRYNSIWSGLKQSRGAWRMRTTTRSK